MFAEELIQAAAALTTALETAMNEVVKKMRNGETPMRPIGTAFDKHLVPVTERYRKLGAYDTEPREIAFSYLELAARIGRLP